MRLCFIGCLKPLLFLVFWVCLVACQTTQTAQEPVQPGDEESAGDIAGEDFGEGEDLESEFADSEDFEKEMAEGQQGEPAQNQQMAEESSDLADEEELDLDEEDMVEVQDPAPPQAEELAPAEEDVADISEPTPEDVTQGPVGGDGDTLVVSSIRYSAEENRIYIEGSGSFAYQQRENPANNQFVVEINNATLSESLNERPFVMKDFNTDMAFLQADQKDSSTVRIVIQMRQNAGMPSLEVGEGGALLISSGSSNNMAGGGGGDEFDPPFEDPAGGDMAGGVGGEVLPAKSLEDFFLKTPRFTGRPISIQFKDVGIRDVLYFISEGTGLNMVLDEDVSGKISIKLRNVPWDQALITVMKTKKLGYVREGSIIRIMSLSSLKKNQEEIQKMLESQKVLEELKVRMIPVTYAKVEDIKKQVDQFLAEDKRSKSIVDSETNSIIVTSTEKSLSRVEQLIKTLDRTPKQVIIEAKIVEASESFVRDLGLQWNYRGTPLSLYSGTDYALDIDGGINIFGSNSAGGSTVTSGLTTRFAPIGTLEANLGLSEVEGKANVISAPRIMVLNGQTATINQSSESLSPKVTTGQDGTSTVSADRATANLSFNVTPNITPLNSIFMDVDVQRQFFGQRETQTGARPTFSRSAKTTILVNNGQTVVIGGIYQYDETEGKEGFPILRHIPIINWLFSRRTTDRQKNELLLFITPRALEGMVQQTADLN